MPTSLYLTAHQPAKQARLTWSSICSILLALDIEDSCREVVTSFRIATSDHTASNFLPLCSRLFRIFNVYLFLTNISLFEVLSRLYNFVLRCRMNNFDSLKIGFIIRNFCSELLNLKLCLSLCVFFKNYILSIFYQKFFFTLLIQSDWESDKTNASGSKLNNFWCKIEKLLKVLK